MESLLGLGECNTSGLIPTFGTPIMLVLKVASVSLRQLPRLLFFLLQQARLLLKVA